MPVALTSITWGWSPPSSDHRRLIHKPHGIILVTGPTVSGKTTTLYAALERINDNTAISYGGRPHRVLHRRHRPVAGKHQGGDDVRARTAGDSPQDPDVVMWARFATLSRGNRVSRQPDRHLVLSTLHTNTAVGAVTRLRDMGIEPFLLSSSLVGVLAQRLVRVLDPDAREAYAAAEYECRLLGLDPARPPTLYRTREDVAGSNGYKGRTGIYELVTIDDELRTMIHDGSGEHELERYARTKGPSIRDDGLKKVLSGVTTLEEVVRVTRQTSGRAERAGLRAMGASNTRLSISGAR